MNKRDLWFGTTEFVGVPLSCLSQQLLSRGVYYQRDCIYGGTRRPHIFCIEEIVLWFWNSLLSTKRYLLNSLYNTGNQ